MGWRDVGCWSDTFNPWWDFVDDCLLRERIERSIKKDQRRAIFSQAEDDPNPKKTDFSLVLCSCCGIQFMTAKTEANNVCNECKTKEKDHESNLSQIN